jgi:hypothetical protein
MRNRAVFDLGLFRKIESDEAEPKEGRLLLTASARRLLPLDRL